VAGGVGEQRAVRAAGVSAGGDAFYPARLVQAVEDREGKKNILTKYFLQFIFSVSISRGTFSTRK
jgi:hypothetical protein